MVPEHVLRRVQALQPGKSVKKQTHPEVGRHSLFNYILDYADKRDGVSGLRVVLVAAQDEGGRHQHVQVEVVKLHPRLGRHLQETENVELQSDTFG